MIPLGTDRPLSRPTVTNHLLLAANIVAFCAIAAVGIQSEQGVSGTEGILSRWMLTPGFTEPWRFITYAFLHDMTSPWHLAGNMLFLWVFGPNVEDRLGRVWYLVFYLAAAIASGLGHILISHAPVIGASGAIAGVTGAYVVLFPRTIIRVFFFFFTVGVIHLSALWFISISILLNVLGVFAHSGSQIAYTAHLAGYAFGAGIAFTLLVTGLLKSETFDLFHLFRQARRRAEIREAYREQRQRTDGPFIPADAPKGVSLPISDLQKPVAEARAEVVRLLNAGDVPAAGDVYRSLIEKYGLIAGAATMSRRHQLDLANHFFQSSDFSSAVATYDRFIEAYPRDAQVPHIRLMLAVIAARYLHQIPRAKSLLAEAMPGLHDPDQLTIAKDLLAELDGPPDPVPSGSALRS